MSLVITVWDKSVGVAVSEGRAIAVVDGNKVPVREDCSKLSRLADGSILGLTGGLRPGYETTSIPDGYVAEPLRREIHALSETHGFRELCAAIPNLLTDYGLRYPELGFGVSLLGDDDGTIRGASFSSTCPACLPDDSDVQANVLGLSEAANQEATIAVRRYIASKPRNFVSIVEATNALREIISDLATRHVELNDRIQVECVAVPGEREVFDFTRLPLCADGTSVSTASRVTSSQASANGVNVSWPTADSNFVPEAVPGFGFSVNITDTSNTLTISGVVACSNETTGSAEFYAAVFVDGNTSTNYSSTLVNSVSASKTVQTTFFASITGLSPGAHTVAVYIEATPPVADFILSVSGQAICQKII